MGSSSFPFINYVFPYSHANFGESYFAEILFKVSYIVVWRYKSGNFPNSCYLITQTTIQDFDVPL